MATGARVGVAFCVAWWAMRSCLCTGRIASSSTSQSPVPGLGRYPSILDPRATAQGQFTFALRTQRQDKAPSPALRGGPPPLRQASLQTGKRKTPPLEDVGLEPAQDQLMDSLKLTRGQMNQLKQLMVTPAVSSHLMSIILAVMNTGRFIIIIMSQFTVRSWWMQATTSTAPSSLPNARKKQRRAKHEAKKDVAQPQAQPQDLDGALQTEACDHLPSPQPLMWVPVGVSWL